MKKRLFVVLAVLALTVCLLPMVVGAEEHVHKNTSGSWSGTPDSHSYTCSCGEVVTEPHKFADKKCDTKCSDCSRPQALLGKHDMAAATCDVPSTCKRAGCGYTVGEKRQHDMAEATCTADAYCKYDDCDYVVVGSAKGHKNTSGSWNGTPDSHSYTCSCGEVVTEPHKFADKNCETKCSDCSRKYNIYGHDMADATCTEPSTCSRIGCGHTEGEPAGHSWEDGYCAACKTTCNHADNTFNGIIHDGNNYHRIDCNVCDMKNMIENCAAFATAATCEGASTCTKCKQHVADALGHDYDDGVVTTKPTCEDKGVMTYTCANDRTHTYTKEIDALGHDWDDGVVTKNPTYNDTGIITYTCKNDATHTKEEATPVLKMPYDPNLDVVPRTGNIFVEWLYALIAG